MFLIFELPLKITVAVFPNSSNIKLNTGFCHGMH